MGQHSDFNYTIFRQSLQGLFYKFFPYFYILRQPHATYRIARRDQDLKAPLRILLLCACGLAAGLINGLLGAGSGVLIVFALHAALGGTLSDTRDVFANATAVILPISLFSAVSYFLNGSLPPATQLGRYLLPGILGGLGGALLLGRLPEVTVRRIFGSVVLVSGLIMLIQ